MQNRGDRKVAMLLHHKRDDRGDCIRHDCHRDEWKKPTLRRDVPGDFRPDGNDDRQKSEKVVPSRGDSNPRKVPSPKRVPRIYSRKDPSPN